MSAPKPDFWNRKLKDINPLGLFSKSARQTFVTEFRDYTHRYNTSSKGLVYLVFIIPACGLISNYIGKNQYEKSFEYH